MTARIATALLAFTASAAPPTFNTDIAPILHANCIVCHHDGGMGPFALGTFAEARKHAQQIAELTAAHTMPPWPPEKGYGDFIGERRLDETQIAQIAEWVRNGSPEGDPAHASVAPKQTEGWKLGTPDLVLTLPADFTLSAAGKDIYRNFIIPVPLATQKYVRAVEIRPTNAKVVHHAFLLLDTEGDALQRDARDPGPGFDGMNAGDGVGSPEGFAIGWQPGRVPMAPRDGCAWPLAPRSSLVLQMHLRPTGKPEPVNARIALYLTDTPPQKQPTTILLRSTNIEIPPGSTNTSASSSYQLPVDVYVLSILPHTHYLSRDLRGWANLPDGTRKALLWIRNWDFNWQGDYRYREPVYLPKGTTLAMRYTFDNTTNNPANPNSPPQHVRYGPQSSDEMAELGFQLLPANPADLDQLRTDYLTRYAIPDTIALNRQRIEQNPTNTEPRTTLASIYARIGRTDEALQQIQAAITHAPHAPKAHRILGQIRARQNDTPAAITAYEAALRDDPADATAHSDLGWILFTSGKKVEGLRHLETADRLRPHDPQTETNLRAARCP